MMWSRDFAYTVGLITTDGCLSKDGQHIDFTSKDLEQIKNFKKLLKLKNKIGIKLNGAKKYSQYRIQFSNVKLYRFLQKIGLSPNKSKTIQAVNVPDKYFIDFIRGLLDGDGYSSSYWDKVYPKSFRFYMGFISVSKNYLEWLQDKISFLYDIGGTINTCGIKTGKISYQLKYAKKNSINLSSKIYYKDNLTCLSRKRTKIKKTLNIIANLTSMKPQ